MKRSLRISTGVTATAALLLGTGIIASAPAFAHGYVEGPMSRSAACTAGLNTGCGSIIYEPQSLEGIKGFPEGGPADGQIASAGGLFGGLLDQQSSDRWYKNEITTGPLLMKWRYTAPHSTAKWHYYMTKPGWNQNAPLSRADLELITEVQHDGSRAVTNPDHMITVPADRSGYHIILAVWDIGDTVNAFYNVIDVNVTGAGDLDTTPPSVPIGLVAADVTGSSVSLTWSESTDDSGVVRYQVLRDGVLVGTTTVAEFVDRDVAPNTSYTYSIVAVDPSGNESQGNAMVTVTTAEMEEVVELAPGAPEFLHSMGTTEDSVRLMWLAHSSNSGDVSYIVQRNGVEIARTTSLMVTDSGLAAGTSYSYTVTAVDAAGRVSTPSNTLVVSTQAAAPAQQPAPEPAPQPAPQPEVAPAPSGSWNAFASYSQGDVVTHNGRTYRAVQSHTGVGDPNWITAPSLWAVVTESTEQAPAPEATPENEMPGHEMHGHDWDPFGSYRAGDRVRFDGKHFEAVQSHTGVGDPNWIYAPSLWKQV